MRVLLGLLLKCRGAYCCRQRRCCNSGPSKKLGGQGALIQFDSVVLELAHLLFLSAELLRQFLAFTAEFSNLVYVRLKFGFTLSE